VPRVTGQIATASDLLAGRFGDRNYELEEGILLLREPAGLRHGVVTLRIAAALLKATARMPGVLVIGPDTGFLISRDPDSVRVPDLAVITGPDVPSLARHTGFAARAPDLAVEVRSPSDTLASQLDKGRMWLACGSRLAWVVDPERAVAYILAPGAPLQRVLRGGLVSGLPVLREVEIPLDELLP
jgi:Uma2 family endonuclease